MAEFSLRDTLLFGGLLLGAGVIIRKIDESPEEVSEEVEVCESCVWVPTSIGTRNFIANCGGCGAETKAPISQFRKIVDVDSLDAEELDEKVKNLIKVGDMKFREYADGTLERFEANEVCYRSCYEGHNWRLSGTSHLGEYTSDGRPIMNWRCDGCGQSKSSPTEPSSKADNHDWVLTKTKNWEDGIFTVYARCNRCGVEGYADGDVEESIDSVHPSLRAESFDAEQVDYDVLLDGELMGIHESLESAKEAAEKLYVENGKSLGVEVLQMKYDDETLEGDVNGEQVFKLGAESFDAESVSDLELQKDSCCCGATKKTPCVCMILGSDCSAKKPMCACYRLKAIQQKDEKGAETFNATTNSKKSEIVPFSPITTWRGNHFPLLDHAHAEIISKIVDGEVLREPNSEVVNYPITRRDIEPITMRWGELFKLCKENDYAWNEYPRPTYTFSLTEGGQKYDTQRILDSFKYLPKKTVLTIYADHNYPLEVIFDYGGEKWVYRQRPKTEHEFEEYEVLVSNNNMEFGLSHNTFRDKEEALDAALNLSQEQTDKFIYVRRDDGKVIRVFRPNHGYGAEDFGADDCPSCKSNPGSYDYWGNGPFECYWCKTGGYYGAETLNDWMMLPNSCGNNDCGDGHCPQCGSCKDWADDEDDDGDFMYYCGSCSHKFYAETFDAECVWRWDYDPMMQNRIDRNQCSHRYYDGDTRGGDAWVLKYADLMGVEDGLSYIEAGVRCGICGQERIGSWGINEKEGFQITKGEEGRMPRVYGWGFYGAESFDAEGFGNSHINKYTWSKDPYLNRSNTLTKEEARKLLETTTKPIKIRVGRSATLHVGRAKVLPNTPQVIGRDEALAFFDNEGGKYVGVALWEYDDHIFLKATTYSEMWAESFDAESRPASYMVKSDAHKLNEASKRIHEKADEHQKYPEWWKSKLSVSRNNADQLADFLDYALIEGVFESEQHGDDEDDHEEIDELIEKLNTVVDFAITFIHDGGYGGEPKGTFVDTELGIKTEVIEYVEGSIQLRLVRDIDTDELLSVRFSLSGEPEETPIVYLPLPERLTLIPEDERSSK